MSVVARSQPEQRCGAIASGLAGGNNWENSNARSVFTALMLPAAPTFTVQRQSRALIGTRKASCILVTNTTAWVPKCMCLRWSGTRGSRRFGFTLVEIRLRADRECFVHRALGHWTEHGRIRIPSHIHGRRFAVTWMVTTTDSCQRIILTMPKTNHFPPNKTHHGASPSPQSGPFPGGVFLIRPD